MSTQQLTSTNTESKYAFKLDPPLLNSSNPWATTYDDLKALYDCPYTGAVTIRTSLWSEFKQDPELHQVSFSSFSKIITWFKIILTWIKVHLLLTHNRPFHLRDRHHPGPWPQCSAPWRDILPQHPRLQSNQLPILHESASQHVRIWATR